MALSVRSRCVHVLIHAHCAVRVSMVRCVFHKAIDAIVAKRILDFSSTVYSHKQVGAYS